MGTEVRAGEDDYVKERQGGIQPLFLRECGIGNEKGVCECREVLRDEVCRVKFGLGERWKKWRTGTK